MSQNAIIYTTLEPQDADILLFVRHSIRLLPVPSQYRRSQSGAREMRVPTGPAGEMSVPKPFRYFCWLLVCLLLVVGVAGVAGACLDSIRSFFVRFSYTEKRTSQSPN